MATNTRSILVAKCSWQLTLELLQRHPGRIESGVSWWIFPGENSGFASGGGLIQSSLGSGSFQR